MSLAIRASEPPGPDRVRGGGGSKRKLARKFNLSNRYIDNLISFNNKIFKEYISDICPKELPFSESTESTSIASYLEPFFTKDKINSITIKLYDKRDTFGFHTVNFPFTVSMYLSSLAMAVVAQIMVTFYHATEPL